MRVVIDTHVFISSFLGTGSPRKIIDFWKDGKNTICLSREIVDEYIEVFERLGLSRKKEIAEILQLFARNYHSLFTAKTPKLEIVYSDPDDNKFFACAVALKAQTVISGDKAVLNVNNYMGIKVLSPMQFVEMLEA